jgi:hypothetical protein
MKCANTDLAATWQDHGSSAKIVNALIVCESIFKMDIVQESKAFDFDRLEAVVFNPQNELMQMLQCL